MEDYIAYLRKQIGHALPQRRFECLSWMRRARFSWKNDVDNGLYCLPGGSIDYEEKVLDGLKSEIREETGISLQKATLFMIQSGKRTTLHYPNGDITNYVVLSFYCPLAIKKQRSLSHTMKNRAKYSFALWNSCLTRRFSCLATSSSSTNNFSGAISGSK
jgi:hypothetical protein